ncbi:hypothetical protein C5167_023430, partial [Papaver somniferum]
EWMWPDFSGSYAVKRGRIYNTLERLFFKSTTDFDENKGWGFVVLNEEEKKKKPRGSKIGLKATVRSWLRLQETGANCFCCG